MSFTCTGTPLLSTLCWNWRTEPWRNWNCGCSAVWTKCSGMAVTVFIRWKRTLCWKTSATPSRRPSGTGTRRILCGFSVRAHWRAWPGRSVRWRVSPAVWPLCRGRLTHSGGSRGGIRMYWRKTNRSRCCRASGAVCGLPSPAASRGSMRSV